MDLEGGNTEERLWMGKGSGSSRRVKERVYE